MVVWRRVGVWLAVVTCGVVLLGLGAFYVHVGLDRADKLASVLGSLAGVAGLGLSVAGIVQARRAATVPAAEPPSGAGHVVSNSSIGGDNIQIGGARDVDIRHDRGR